MHKTPPKATKWTIILLSIYTLIVLVAASSDSAPIPPSNSDSIRSIQVDPYPVNGAAIDQFGTVTTEQHPPEKTHPNTNSNVKPTSIAAEQLVPAAIVEETKPSPAAAVESKVYTPVPDHLLDDDLPPLVRFDGAVVHSLDSTSGKRLPPPRAHLTSVSSMTIRVSRRVTSAGMWDPNMQHAYGKPKPTTEMKPPETAPLVVASSLNLALSALYSERKGVDVYRGLELHVLPGPSFSRGSLAAMSERWGAPSIGFEHSFLAMHDQRFIESSTEVDDNEEEEQEQEDGETDSDGQTNKQQKVTPRKVTKIVFRSSDSEFEEANRLPGYGAIHQLRTMSGQHNENWIMYSSGIYDEANQRVIPQVAIYALLVHVWVDPTLAKEQTAAHKESVAQGFNPPPLSMNALGLRVRVAPDFVIRPIRKDGKAMPALPLAGVNDAQREAMAASIESDENSPAKPYARIVDFVMYQQKKFIFLGAAYDDGHLRIFSRNGTIRNELHTRNSTILSIAMSNWGSSTSVTSQSGGGARDANAALNGMQNGNQLLAYVTPSGLGLLKMSRIYKEIDNYCRWDATMHSNHGIRSGYDISGVAFDAISMSVMYLVNQHDLKLYVLNTELGRFGKVNFDEHGKRIRHPLGNSCLTSADIAIRLSPAASASASSSLRSSSSLYANTPQFALHALRGLLLVSSNMARAVQVYNTSTVHDIPESVGVEFVMERGLPLSLGGSPSTGTAAPAVVSTHEQLQSRTPKIVQLVGDRIDLLMLTSVQDCSIDPSVCTIDVTSTSTIPVFPLHIFHLFLNQIDRNADNNKSWFGGFSRVPLFILGLFLVFGYKWWKKREANRLAQEEQDAAMFERATGGFGSRRRAGGGATADLGRDFSSPLDEALGRGGGPSGLTPRGNKSGGGHQLDDAFDSQNFMKEFLEWKSSPEGMRTAASIAKDKPRGAALLDMLSKDRDRLEARSGGGGGRAGALFNPGRRDVRRPDPIPKKPYEKHMHATRNLASIEQERVEFRRRLKEMDQGRMDSDVANVLNLDFIAQGQPNAEELLGKKRASASSQKDGALGIGQNSYDSEEYDSDTREELAAAQADLQSGPANKRVTFDVDEPVSNEDDEDDGPTYHGTYDDYEYHHSEYAQQGRGDSNAASGENSNTFQIDEVFHEEGDDGVQYDEDEGDDVLDEDGEMDELPSEERDATFREKWAEIQRQAQLSRKAGPTLPAEGAKVQTISGFGHSGDDISHYEDAHGDLDEDLDPNQEHEDWVEEEEALDGKPQPKQTDNVD